LVADTSMADRERRHIAAERLSRVLGAHGVVVPRKAAVSYALIGLLAGVGIGLFLGWLIWA
jgi:hypothetical protein